MSDAALPTGTQKLCGDLLLLIVNIRNCINRICCPENSDQHKLSLCTDLIDSLVSYCSFSAFCSLSDSYLQSNIPEMLKLMETSFPSANEWNLSNMNDLDQYLPQLSQIPLTRELNSLIFEIRKVGKLISSFEQSHSSVENIGSDSRVVFSSSQSLPPVGPSTSSVSIHLRLQRSICRLPTTTEVSSVIEPILSIRVKQATQTEKIAKETGVVEGVVFPVKVRRYYTIILFFFINLP